MATPFLPPDIPNFPVGAKDSGQDWRPYASPCTAASTANVTGTWAAGGGATSTGSISGAPIAMDGVTLQVGNRVLLKNQSTAARNGIYVVTAVTSTTADIERTSDYGASYDFFHDKYVRIVEGTVSAGKYFALGDDPDFVLNTDDPTITEATPPRNTYVGGY